MAAPTSSVSRASLLCLARHPPSPSPVLFCRLAAGRLAAGWLAGLSCGQLRAGRVGQRAESVWTLDDKGLRVDPEPSPAARHLPPWAPCSGAGRCGECPGQGHWAGAHWRVSGRRKVPGPWCTQRLHAAGSSEGPQGWWDRAGGLEGVCGALLQPALMGRGPGQGEPWESPAQTPTLREAHAYPSPVLREWNWVLGTRVLLFRLAVLRGL